MSFQSTLPRRERLLLSSEISAKILISIHAPAKGATRIRCSVCGVSTISIHAPAKGATPNRFRLSHRGTEFQSTLPRRERQGELKYFDPLNEISIHAPAKGATIMDLTAFELFSISIHAPAKGATYQTQHEQQYQKISIHAPAKGATSSGGAG